MNLIFNENTFEANKKYKFVNNEGAVVVMTLKVVTPTQLVFSDGKVIEIVTSNQTKIVNSIELYNEVEFSPEVGKAYKMTCSFNQTPMYVICAELEDGVYKFEVLDNSSETISMSPAVVKDGTMKLEEMKDFIDFDRNTAVVLHYDVDVDQMAIYRGIENEDYVFELLGVNCELIRISVEEKIPFDLIQISLFTAQDIICDMGQMCEAFSDKFEENIREIFKEDNYTEDGEKTSEEKFNDFVKTSGDQLQNVVESILNEVGKIHQKAKEEEIDKKIHDVAVKLPKQTMEVFKMINKMAKK